MDRIDIISTHYWHTNISITHKTGLIF